MADKILHKRSFTSGSIPTTSSLLIGEIALNVPDGKIYIHKSGSQGESIESAITSNSTASIGILTLSGSLILSGSTAVNSGSILDIATDNILFDFDSLAFSGSAEITGSLIVTSGITGSLSGSASTATSASFAATASFVQTAQTASYVLNAVSSSFALTSSYSNLVVNSTPIGGVVNNGEILYRNGGVLSTSTNLAFNATLGRLSVGQGLSPGARLDIRAQGSASSDSVLRIRNNGNTFDILNLTGDNILSLSGSSNITGSLAVTRNITGSRMILSASNSTLSGSTLTVIGSGSTQPVFTVQGSQGELFSVTDSLSGSLFSVNDISGLPILEVFSDNTTLIGNYLDPMLITTAKVTQTNSGSFTVYALPTASYDTAFFEYSVKSGSNARAGTIMAIQSGSSVNYTETTTTDFGTTTAISLGVFVTGSNMALTGSSTTGSWTIKAIVRGL